MKHNVCPIKNSSLNSHVPEGSLKVRRKLPQVVRMEDVEVVQKRTGRKLMSLETRFWRHVDKRGPDECWPWLGSMATNGYGRIRVRTNGSKCVCWLAHRVAYLLHYGSIRTDLHCCHKCDVVNCTNVAHLFMGTAKDNQDDCRAKGRNTYGEKHGMHKLDAIKVKEIRNLYASGYGDYNKLAIKFSVSSSTIGCIVKRKLWSHIV